MPEGTLCCPWPVLYQCRRRRRRRRAIPGKTVFLIETAPRSRSLGSAGASGSAPNSGPCGSNRLFSETRVHAWVLVKKIGSPGWGRVAILGSADISGLALNLLLDSLDATLEGAQETGLPISVWCAWPWNTLPQTGNLTYSILGSMVSH